MVALTSFTISTRNSEIISEELLNYFVCEGRGNDPNNPCDRNTFSQYLIPELTTISLVLIEIFPVINLVYVLSIKELKEKFKSCAKFKSYAVRKKLSMAQLTNSSNIPTSS